MINVEYIHDYGYIVETDHAIYIFDYVNGLLPSPYLLSGKETFFIVSSRHQENYSEAIYRFGKTVILSSDILVSPYRNVFKVSTGDTINLGFARIYVLPGAMSGVSYLIKEENISVYFAGSVQKFHSEGNAIEQRYEAQVFYDTIQTLSEFGPVDVVIARVNPELRDAFDSGPRYIIENVEPLHFFPMNFGPDIHAIAPLYEWGTMHLRTKFYVPLHDNFQFKNIVRK